MSNGITQEQEQQMESHLLFPAAIDVCTSELYLYKYLWKSNLNFKQKLLLFSSVLI